MDNQNIGVAFIVLLAASYIGLILFKKLKSLTSNGSCDAGCGCGAGAKTRKPFARAGKN